LVYVDIVKLDGGKKMMEEKIGLDGSHGRRKIK
jgi:hypothetical protein